MILRALKKSDAERGYALLMVIFIGAAMLIMAAAAMPNLLTQGRRQKEDEMIWRGGQYERAVRLYYHKYGRFPQQIDDLAKNNNGIRFLRQAYPDPSNKGDGTWRMIYIGPAGQLIGSARYKTLAQLYAAQHPGQATPFGSFPPNAAAGGSPGASAFGGPGTQGVQPGGLSQQPGGLSQQPGPGQTGPQSQNLSGQPQSPDQSGSSSSSESQPSDLSSGPVLGGNIVGVGGTARRTSLKIFEGGKTYHDWEFIWNPLADATIGNQRAPLPGQPAGGSQGGNPAGTTPGAPLPPPTQPPPPQQ